MTLVKKIWLMLAAIILTTVVAAGIYVTTAYRFSTSELAKTFKDYRNSGQVSQAIQDNAPFSVLLMGVDTGSESRTEQWVGNSDSMILVTVNPKTEKTTVTSLERDILVELVGPKDNDANGLEAKLNAAYASGSAEMALLTVESLLDIEIDYYMQLNMKGLVDLVDALGGITVTNDFDYPIRIDDWEPEYTATVDPGTHLVNGDQALVYSRMRYDDPEGDYGRQKRQRAVIQKILNKLLALDSISSYRSILRAVSSNMQTDIEISSQTIPSLLTYRGALSNIKNYQLHGEDAEINGGSYQVVTAEHLLETQNRIKKELGLATSKTLKTNAVLYETVYGLPLTIRLAEEEDDADDEEEELSSSTTTSSQLPSIEEEIVQTPVQEPAVVAPVYTEEVAQVPVQEQIVQQPAVVEQPVVIEQPATVDQSTVNTTPIYDTAVQTYETPVVVYDQPIGQ